MKRIQLFELEDLASCPGWLRVCITRLISVIHRGLGSSEKVASLLARMIAETGETVIIDLCSGSGGPMPEAYRILKGKYGLTNIQLLLTDLYPDLRAAHGFNSQNAERIRYQTEPANALTAQPPGLRTMICCFHHLCPEDATQILRSASASKQPICIYELSDNSIPSWLWWVVFPCDILLALLVTPWVRPLSWQQLVFTYLVPIIPICFAWDGTVTNARTYGPNDLAELLERVPNECYHWEVGSFPGQPTQLYLLGFPSR